MKGTPGSAREAAFVALTKIRTREGYADRVLSDVLRRAALETRDAALCTSLVYGVLQNRLLCDTILGSFSKVPVRKMESAVLDLLRLGVCQLYFMDKIPESAAVNETVALARRHTSPRAAGFVNAVLRAAAQKAPELPPLTGDRMTVLSTRYSVPKPLLEEMLRELPEDEWDAFCASLNEIPPTVLQVNTLRCTVEQLWETLTGIGLEPSRHPWQADTLVLDRCGDLTRWDAYRQGWFWVSDPAAVLAAFATLTPQPALTGAATLPVSELLPTAFFVVGQLRILDACAAPGGKSFALARLLREHGQITACDIHPHKIDLLSEGAARLGMDKIIRPALLDATVHHTPFDGAFDIVFCDVPCSGLGILRKKPDIRYKDVSEFAVLPELQLSILNNCSNYVAFGGVLLYATCTVRSAENGEVVKAFLAEHPEFAVETECTLWPHRDDTDGFYYARLKRRPPPT